MRVKTTYDFGAGPVPAHRHPNGGGWVADTARVDDTAYVGEYARVSGRAQVYSRAKVYGGALVSGNARVSGNAQVYGDAWISGNAWVYGYAQIRGAARVFGNARASQNTINLAGLRYNVTICDDHTIIGCKCYTHEEWMGFTDAEINAMNSDALEWWTAYKPVVSALINQRKVVNDGSRS